MRNNVLLLPDAPGGIDLAPCRLNLTSELLAFFEVVGEAVREKQKPNEVSSRFVRGLRSEGLQVNAVIELDAGGCAV